MADRARNLRRRGTGWCCAFAGSPQSPEHRALPAATPLGGAGVRKQLPPKSPSSAPSFHSSPSSKLAGLIDPRRILSPGRVSPIDPDGSPAVAMAAAAEDQSAAAVAVIPPFVAVREERAEEEAGRGLNLSLSLLGREGRCVAVREEEECRGLDLSLCLRGRDGRCVAMELDSAVLCESSAFFAAMAPPPDAAAGGGGKRIEVDGVENVAAFKETVELMFEPDALRWLARAGVSRAIGVLEVASSIMFDRGIKACLEYIEAVPWNENEEEKLKNLFAKCTFDDALTKDVLARLQPQCRSDSEDLTSQLIQSVTSSTNNLARKDMQSLINGLLSKSSVYQKDLSGLNKRSLYQICCSCVSSLVELYKEDSSPVCHTDHTWKVRGSKPMIERVSKQVRGSKPMIERVSKQTENLTWLFEILVNNDMAEEFVELWAKQEELISMHEQASPMFRYELSRISASLFVALGKGKVQCPSDLRSQLFRGWFMPILMDFGWLQRCSKGLDVRSLEENLGHALLTLPLQLQQSLFEEWFRFFSSRGTECPNLGRAFQVWWRRLFVRSSGEVRR